MYAVVDLETTGGNPGTDKIIEIAVYIHDGEKISREYSSLVNPQVPIPFFISRLTGITQEMVDSAPLFSDIADTVSEILGGHIFVAHNVQFDYSFIAYALGQHGIPYENKMLCTCKTSRLLFPGYPSYSLGKICSALSITLNNAHRASADAKATAHLLDMLLTKSGGILDPFYSQKHKVVNHSRIPDTMVDKLPSKAGILYFYDEAGTVIYISASNNLRKKALSIINKIHTKRYAGLCALATSVDCETTGGVLLSAIREIEAVTLLQPRFNRKFKSIESRFSIYENLNNRGYLVLELGKYDLTKKSLVTFTTEQEANVALSSIITTHNLFSVSDFNAAMPVENYDEYNLRVTTAIIALSQKKKNFLITDRGPHTDHFSMVVIEDGRYTGYIFADRDQSRLEVAELLELKQHATDQSTVFKSIIRHVSQGKYQKIINF